MEDIIQRIIDNQFRDLKGLSVSGSVPVSESLINDLVNDFLRSAQSAKGPVAAEPTPPIAANSPAEKIRIGVPEIAKLVRNVAVRAEQGRVVVDFEISV